MKMQYAVRGPLVIRATELEKELQAGVKKPFDSVIKANIGDAHAMGNKPIVFIRQVLALVTHPPLLESDEFPEDAKDRARAILAGCKGGSVGSYSDSPGIEIIRRHVAEYIEQRDGMPSGYADWKNIILCAGASESIRGCLKLMTDQSQGKRPGVMIPIPQYPLYSASLAEYNMEQVGYYLVEERGWALDLAELERSYQAAKDKCDVKAIVVINPGNPTGQVLSRANIEMVLKFALEKKLFVFADEVYQHNVYAEGSEFHSFKKVMTEMGSPYSCMEVVVNPPRESDPSYSSWKTQVDGVLASLAERAKLVADTLNSIEGITCNTVQGAMYAFPQIHLPEKAIAAAKEAGMPADVFYAFQLLEAKGICIIPGSGFGQQPGTFHFRTTILPQKDMINEMLGRLKEFHMKFLAEHS